MADDRPPSKPAGSWSDRAAAALLVLRAWVLPGLVLSTLLAVGAALLRTPGVEADIAARVTERLAEGGYDWATVAVGGREVTLSGTAPSLVVQSEAREIAAGVWGVGQVTDLVALIPVAIPFDWTAARTGDTILLTGHVPTEPIRQALQELVAVNQPQGRIEDRTVLARGAPPDFQLGAEFALRILANLQSGSVSVVGSEISAEGLAADSLRYETIGEIVGSGQPAGYVVARADILPPLAEPYLWSVAFIGDSVEIRGNVPSTAMGMALATAVGEALPDRPVQDRSVLASGEPAGFETMARYALGLAARLTTGAVTLTDATLDIYGRARTPEDYEALGAELGQPPPAGLTVTSDIIPALAPAYVFEAVRSGSGVELVGFMPSAEARAEIAERARALFGEGETTDRLQIADGAPRMDWIGAAMFALDQVSLLGSGSARIADRSYFITGAAATSEAYERLETELTQPLPASLELAENLVAAPLASPYRFTAAAAPDGVTLTGNAPSVELRAAMVEAASIRFEPLPVSNQIGLAAGAPVGFDAAVLAGLQAISRLEAGRLEVVDTTVVVNGVAPHEGAVERIEQQLESSVPAGFTVSATLAVQPAESPVSAPACQDLLDAELGTGTVKFAEGASTIAPESQGRLDRLVAIVQRCLTASIEIGGHTDADGSEAGNLALSQARAEAVVDYLVQAGVARDRLTAVGYGETLPVATNDTEEGRASNRRMEFTLTEP